MSKHRGCFDRGRWSWDFDVEPRKLSKDPKVDARLLPQDVQKPSEMETSQQNEGTPIGQQGDTGVLATAQADSNEGQ